MRFNRGLQTPALIFAVLLLTGVGLPAQDDEREARIEELENQLARAEADARELKARLNRAFEEFREREEQIRQREKESLLREEELLKKLEEQKNRTRELESELDKEQFLAETIRSVFDHYTELLKPLVMEVAEEGPAELRRSAYRLISIARFEEAIPLLKSALQASRWEERLAAAEALSSFETHQELVREQLRSWATDSSGPAELRRGAFLELLACSPASQLPGLIPVGEGIGPAAMRPLIEALAKESYPQAIPVALALASRDDQDAEQTNQLLLDLFGVSPPPGLVFSELWNETRDDTLNAVRENAKILAFLFHSRVSLEFSETPVREVFEFIGQFGQMNCYCFSSVREEGITFKVVNVSPEEALSRLLSERGMGRKIRGGVLFVGKPEELQQVVDLDALMEIPPACEPDLRRLLLLTPVPCSFEEDSLLDIVQFLQAYMGELGWFVSRGLARDMERTASFELEGVSLVTALRTLCLEVGAKAIIQGHWIALGLPEEIDLLGEGPQRVDFSRLPPGDREVAEELARWRVCWDWRDAPLGDIFSYLQNLTGIRIVALEGVDLESPALAYLGGTELPLEEALLLLLRFHSLRYRIQDGVIQIFREQ